MMKKATLIFLFLFAFCFSSTQAQSGSCGLITFPLNCTVDPINPMIADFAVATELSVKYAQKNKIFDISYYNSDQFLSDCGTVSPYLCTEDIINMLTYDVYFPSPAVYSCYKKNPLPAIILFHGGGFSDCSSVDGTGAIVQYCMEFAKRGFVAFNVQYRTGRIKDPQTVPGESGNYMSASNLLAIYRAFQDARGAVRSIISRQLGPTPPPYKIDLNNIVVGGISAGGFISQSIAYYNPDMLYEIFGDARAKMGSLDENAYKGSPDINFKVKAVLNLWGGAYFPASYGNTASGFFSKNTDKRGNNLNPPMIAFQGMQDNVVPLKKANIYYSVSPTFIKTKVCADTGEVTYTLSNNDTDKSHKDLILYGTQNFYDMLTGDFNVPSELYLDSDMQHGLSDKSDFGTNANVKQDKTAIIPYIVQRAMAFFQSVANNFDTKLTDTKFTDCENFRTGCSAKSNHEACSTTTATTTSQNNNATIINHKRDILFTASQMNKIIQLSILKDGESDIIVADLYGNPVKKISRNYSRQVSIDAQSFSTGIYIVSLVQHGKSQTIKVSLL